MGEKALDVAVRKGGWVTVSYPSTLADLPLPIPPTPSPETLIRQAPEINNTIYCAFTDNIVQIYERDLGGCKKNEEFRARFYVEYGAETNAIIQSIALTPSLHRALDPPGGQIKA